MYMCGEKNKNKNRKQRILQYSYYVEDLKKEEKENRPISMAVKAKKDPSHLGVNQPAVVKRDVQKIKHNAFWGVLKDSHPGELHVHV